jgi:hypothetical protein
MDKCTDRGKTDGQMGRQTEVKQMDRRTEVKQMHRRTEVKQMHRRTEVKQMHRRTEVKQIDRRTNGQTDRGITDRWNDKHFYELIGKQAKGGQSDGVTHKQIGRQVNRWTDRLNNRQVVFVYFDSLHVSLAFESSLRFETDLLLQLVDSMNGRLADFEVPENKLNIIQRFYRETLMPKDMQIFAPQDFSPFFGEKSPESWNLG